MGTTKAEIRTWLKSAKEGGATHVIIVCDTFSHEDFPMPVLPDEDVHEKIAEYSNNAEKMTRVMEVYAMHLDIDAQLNERRAYHPESRPVGGPAKVAVIEGSPTHVALALESQGRKPVGSVGPSTHGGTSSPSPVRRSDEEREGTAGRVRPISRDIANAGGLNVPSQEFLDAFEGHFVASAAIDCACGRTFIANSPRHPALRKLTGAEMLEAEHVFAISICGRTLVVGCMCGELLRLLSFIWDFQASVEKYIVRRRRWRRERVSEETAEGSEEFASEP